MFESITIGNIKAFLEVLTKARDIILGYSSNDQRIFDEAIEPLFAELQKVIDDYFSLFRGTLDDLRETSDGTELRSALRNLRRNREVMLTTRVKVREMAKEIRQAVKNRKIRTFLDRMERIFYASDVPLRKLPPISSSQKTLRLLEMASSSQSSLIITQVKLGQSLKRGEVSKEFIIRAVECTVDEIANAWVLIAQDYARLRLAYRSRGNLKR